MTEKARPFDAAAYLGCTARGVEAVRRIQFLLVLTCGLILLFVVRVEPFRNHPTQLDYLSETKSEFDELVGQQSAFEAKMEEMNEGALGESINEIEQKKREKLALMYCTIQERDGDCQTDTEAELANGQLEQEAVRSKLRERLKLLQAQGTGLKVPLLEEVIEVELVPRVFTVLIIALLLALNVAEANLAGIVTLYLHDATVAGVSASAGRWLMLSMPWAGLLTSNGGLNAPLRYTVLILHGMPFAVTGGLLLKHRYLFYGSGGPGHLSLTPIAAYSLGVVLIGVLGVRAAFRLLAIVASCPSDIEKGAAA